MADRGKVSGFVDLHVHTTCSDGTFTPEEVVHLAAKEGIKVLAITDHDNIDGIRRAQAIGNLVGVEVIPGIECSTTFETERKGTRHVLGYNIDPENEILKDFVEKCKQDRIERIKKTLFKLRALGIYLDFEDVKKFSVDGSIGRPHVARALAEKGYVSSKKEAFELYLKKGMQAYVPRSFISVEEVIFVIKSAGGIPVLAHPFQMNYEDLETTLQEVERLVNKGIEGIEMLYPDHSKEQNYSLGVFALNNNLYMTAGSDFHGDNKSIELGKCFFNKHKVSIEGLKMMGKTFI